MPQASEDSSKLSVRNGMRISADQPNPPRAVRASQMPSQALLTEEYPVARTSPSPISPAGLVSKKYAVRPSRNVSRISMKRSSDDRSWSRCRWKPMMPSGSLSCSVAPMYRLSASYATRTSVRSVGCWPSTGSCCRSRRQPAHAPTATRRAGRRARFARPGARRTACRVGAAPVSWAASAGASHAPSEPITHAQAAARRISSGRPRRPCTFGSLATRFADVRPGRRHYEVSVDDCCRRGAAVGGRFHEHPGRGGRRQLAAVSAGSGLVWQRIAQPCPNPGVRPRTSSGNWRCPARAGALRSSGRTWSWSRPP